MLSAFIEAFMHALVMPALFWVSCPVAPVLRVRLVALAMFLVFDMRFIAIYPQRHTVTPVQVMMGRQCPVSQPFIIITVVIIPRSNMKIDLATRVVMVTVGIMIIGR